MALSPTSPTRQPAASEPAYRRLHRAFFAFCIILAPLLVSGWFALCPQYGDPTCPSSVNHLSVLVAYRAANPLLATLENSYFSISPEAYVMAAGWVVGHLLGYVLLGIALARARLVPQWAAWLLVASAPLMGPIAYGTGLGILQVLGYVLVFIGSIPAAFAMLKGSEIPCIRSNSLTIIRE